MKLSRLLVAAACAVALAMAAPSRASADPSATFVAPSNGITYTAGELPVGGNYTGFANGTTLYVVLVLQTGVDPSDGSPIWTIQDTAEFTTGAGGIFDAGSYNFGPGNWSALVTDNPLVAGGTVYGSVEFTVMAPPPPPPPPPPGLLLGVHP